MNILVKGVKIPQTVAEYHGETVLRLANKLLGNTATPEWIDAELAASLYYAFYLPIPEVERDNRNPAKTSILESVLDSPNFWRIKPRTVVDRLVSMVASASFLEKLVRNLPKSDSTTSGKDELDKAGNLENLRRAVATALRQAEKDSKIAKDLEAIITTSIAGSTSELAFEDVLEEVLLLARKTDIEKVLEKLNGVKLPDYLAKRTEAFTKGWIEGIEIGGDLERVHPSQLALPDDVFYLLLAESKLLLYRRVFPLREGPIYVILDKSGSMQGAKIDWARAVAIALFQRSVREGRRYYVRFFDALPHELQMTPSYPKPRNVLKILEYLGTVKAGGGTDITRAIATAVSDIEMGKVKATSDLILITDGEDKLSDTVLSGLLKRVKIRLHTIMIGGDNPSLKRVSTSYMTIKTLSKRDLVKVIDVIEKSRAVEPDKSK